MIYIKQPVSGNSRVKCLWIKTETILADKEVMRKASPCISDTFSAEVGNE